MLLHTFEANLLHLIQEQVVTRKRPDFLLDEKLPSSSSEKVCHWCDVTPVPEFRSVKERGRARPSEKRQLTTVVRDKAFSCCCSQTGVDIEVFICELRLEGICGSYQQRKQTFLFPSCWAEGRRGKRSPISWFSTGMCGVFQYRVCSLYLSFRLIPRWVQLPHLKEQWSITQGNLQANCSYYMTKVRLSRCGRAALNVWKIRICRISAAAFFDIDEID